MHVWVFFWEHNADIVNNTEDKSEILQKAQKTKQNYSTPIANILYFYDFY